MDYFFGLKNSLQNLARSRQENNLNAIRLILAILVILDHSSILATGEKKDPLFIFSHYQMAFGDVAVNLFFFISGFLITASWLNCRTMDDYMRRRILRIFPGYIVALVFSFLVATAFASQPFNDLYQHLLKFGDILSLDYFTSVGDWVFPNNPFPGIANGSLWTITWEFVCYLMVAFIGLFGLFRRRILILGIFILFLAFYCFLFLNGTVDTVSSLRLFAFFLTGVCVWLWRDKIPVNNTYGLLALFLALVTTQYPPFSNLLAPLSTSYLVLWIGFAPRIKFLAWCDKTDLSYGVYLFAFPLQQILAWIGIRNPWLMFGLATPLTMVIAFVSWNYIEKPCLKLKSKHFRGHDLHRATDSSQTPISSAKINW